MTRREWLQKNPPPRAGAALRELLARLNAESAARQQLEANKITYGHDVAYWNQQVANARAAGDTATVTQANAQLADFQIKLREIEKDLAATAQLPTHIAEIQAELSRAAKCPVHQTDLLRHKNRPDDLFLCEVGPHFFLWTKVGAGPSAGAQLSPVDINRPMPDIDGEMEWM
jgi:hypothetical protein